MKLSWFNLLYLGFALWCQLFLTFLLTNKCLLVNSLEEYLGMSEIEQSSKILRKMIVVNYQKLNIDLIPYSKRASLVWWPHNNLLSIRIGIKVYQAGILIYSNWIHCSQANMWLKMQLKFGRKHSSFNFVQYYSSHVKLWYIQTDTYKI